MRPGTYAKSLDFIRNLTKTDAAKFEKLAKFAMRFNTNAFIAAHDKQWLSSHRTVSTENEHFLLGELGVLYPTDLSIRLFRDALISEEVIFYGHFLLHLKRSEGTAEIQLPIWKFTAVGSELRSVPTEPDEEYLASIGQFLAANKVVVILGRITQHLADGNVSYETVRELKTDAA